jgi:hypothetical protein
MDFVQATDMVTMIMQESAPYQKMHCARLKCGVRFSIAPLLLDLSISCAHRPAFWRGLGVWIDQCFDHMTRVFPLEDYGTACVVGRCVRC